MSSVNTAVERVESAQPQFLTVEQVAALLQVNPKTVTRWSLRDASMPVIRLGRVVRFERAALLRWIARRGSQVDHRSHP